MRNKIIRRKDTIFAIIVSLILHIFVFSFINTSIMKSVFAYDRAEELEEDDYMFLVETPDIEEEKNEEDTLFASDKSLRSRGQINVNPSKTFSDTSVFSFFGDGANSPIVERRENISPNNNDNNIKRNELGENISREKVETYKPKNPGIKGNTKIPASFVTKKIFFTFSFT